MGAGRVLLAKLSSEFSSLLLLSKLEEKGSFCICWPSSIMMSVPSVSLEASTTLAFDAFPSHWCQSLIWRFLLSN